MSPSRLYFWTGFDVSVYLDSPALLIMLQHDKLHSIHPAREPNIELDQS